jgi:transcriptional antiterminator NusG
MTVSTVTAAGIVNKQKLIQSTAAGACIGKPQNWYVVYVKSRQEFVTAADLMQKNIVVFLPTFKKVNQWKDRRKLVEYPLFPGYLFVQLSDTPGAYLEVLKTRGVVTFVSLEPGTPTPVDSAEMTSLRLLLESGKEIDVRPGLQEGTRVRLTNGPLVDASGILIRKENEFVFVVNIELLGRNVAVRVSPQDIEAL